MNRPQVQQLADSIAQQAADLMAARVALVDEREAVIAESTSPGCPANGASQPPLRVPIQLNGATATVLVFPSVEAEPISCRLAKGIVDLIVTQVSVIDRLPHQHELKSQFIHKLLHGDVENEREILREAHILGMDLARPRAVILIDVSDYVLPAKHPEPQSNSSHSAIWLRSQYVISRVVNFFSLPNDAICAYIGEGEVAILKASSSQDLGPWAELDPSQFEVPASWANLKALKRAGRELLLRLRRDTGSNVNIGIGRYHSGIAGLARSYRDARTALSLGKQFRGLNRLHCLDELGLAAFVGTADQETKIGLAAHLLGPLDQEAELLETISAFLEEDCSASRAACRLSIHRNTLTYRLDKIAFLTGLNPHKFDDAVLIRLALVLLHLGKQSQLCKGLNESAEEHWNLNKRPMNLAG